MDRYPILVAQMRRQIVRYANTRSLKVLFVALILFIGGCTSSKPPEFRTGFVFPGSENTISLDGFWFNIEGGGVSPADKITPVFDPIGGYLFLYWLDDKGNVCSGQPGVSGQPGAAYVLAFRQQAWDVANTNTSITTSQMVDFQKIPYRVASYIAATQASGLHFVQFGNRLIRAREDGTVSRLGAGELNFSVPLIISIDSTNTLFPIYPDKGVTCSQGLGGYVPLPNLGRPKGQNSNMCATRALPVSDSMSYQESVKYCLINLPQGMTWWYMP